MLVANLLLGPFSGLFSVPFLMLLSRARSDRSRAPFFVAECLRCLRRIGRINGSRRRIMNSLGEFAPRGGGGDISFLPPLLGLPSQVWLQSSRWLLETGTRSQGRVGNSVGRRIEEYRPTIVCTLQGGRLPRRTQWFTHLVAETEKEQTKYWELINWHNCDVAP